MSEGHNIKKEKDKDTPTNVIAGAARFNTLFNNTQIGGNLLP